MQETHHEHLGHVLDQFLIKQLLPIKRLHGPLLVEDAAELLLDLDDQPQRLEGHRLRLELVRESRPGSRDEFRFVELKMQRRRHHRFESGLKFLAYFNFNALRSHILIF